jgi:hypothetical protein
MEHINPTTIDLTIFKGESFCRAACWFDIITLAYEKPSTIYWRGSVVKLHRGEFATSVRLLADRWSMTAERARARLKEFTEAGLIRVAHSAGGIIITVLALCHECSVKDDEAPTFEPHNSTKEQDKNEQCPEPMISDERDLAQWFDDISCDKDLRQQLYNEHGIRNWTKLRLSFGKFLLTDLKLAAQWLSGDNEVRLKILLENIAQLAELGASSKPQEFATQVGTSRGRRIKQDGNYIIIPDDAPDQPSVEHLWDAEHNKWILSNFSN